MAEARQRLKDLKAKQVAALAPAGRPEGNATTSKESEKSGVQPPSRNLYSPEEARKVAAIGAAQELVMPVFSIDEQETDATYAKFVGVWSNKAGWGKGKGRYAMVIIRSVSATGLARGYYLWGPPKPNSGTRAVEAGNKWFVEYIVNDKFSIKTNPEIDAKLDNKNVLTLEITKATPDQSSSIELRPVWQLVRPPEVAEPSTKRDEPSPKREKSARPTAPKANAAAEAGARPTVSGSTMEERYRACKKLVKGFAQREACARGGAI